MDNLVGVGRTLGVSDYLIAEFTCTNEEREYTYKEYLPSDNIMIS
ncbi:hypothetical protein bcf_25660 [Bacillus cereus F837/76]|nr:hypothetical protein bcf_25660 [Bacillus cereus F837/76]